MSWFTNARVGTVASPDRDGVPSVGSRPGWRLLVRHDPVEKGRGGVGVRCLQEDPRVVAEQPGVQRLHPDEVGDSYVLVSRGSGEITGTEYVAA